MSQGPVVTCLGEFWRKGNKLDVYMRASLQMTCERGSVVVLRQCVTTCKKNLLQILYVSAMKWHTVLTLLHSVKVDQCQRPYTSNKVLCKSWHFDVVQICFECQIINVLTSSFVIMVSSRRLYASMKNTSSHNFHCNIISASSAATSLYLNL